MKRPAKAPGPVRADAEEEDPFARIDATYRELEREARDDGPEARARRMRAKAEVSQ